jgi:hypothetical protein
MKTGYFKKFSTAFLLTPALLIGTLPAAAQWNGRDNDRNRVQYQQRYDRHDRDRNYDRRDYDRDRYRNSGYVTYAPAYGYSNYGDNGYYVQDNGIGPGKGAAIGAVSGVVLGALLGGGKGAVIGGAAGAGVGAIAGQAAQNNRRGNYRY